MKASTAGWKQTAKQEGLDFGLKIQTVFGSVSLTQIKKGLFSAAHSRIELLRKPTACRNNLSVSVSKYRAAQTIAQNQIT